MKKKQFPQVIHVTIEEPENDEPYYAVMEGGVFDVDEHGKRIAVYKLVTKGKVQIQKRMVK